MAAFSDYLQRVRLRRQLIDAVILNENIIMQVRTVSADSYIQTKIECYEKVYYFSSVETVVRVLYTVY